MAKSSIGLLNRSHHDPLLAEMPNRNFIPSCHISSDVINKSCLPRLLLNLEFAVIAISLEWQGSIRPVKERVENRP